MSPHLECVQLLSFAKIPGNNAEDVPRERSEKILASCHLADQIEAQVTNLAGTSLWGPKSMVLAMQRMRTVRIGGAQACNTNRRAPKCLLCCQMTIGEENSSKLWQFGTASLLTPLCIPSVRKKLPTKFQVI